MRLKNTSRYPEAEVRALVEFACRGVDMTGVQVNVKNSRQAYRGRAYNGVPSVSPASRLQTVSRLVVVAVGQDQQFPVVNYYSTKLKRVPRVELQNWREALVKVAAHEARHVHQYRHDKPRSEVDAEKWAVRRLEEYRASTTT